MSEDIEPALSLVGAEAVLVDATTTSVGTVHLTGGRVVAAPPTGAEVIDVGGWSSSGGWSPVTQCTASTPRSTSAASSPSSTACTLPPQHRAGRGDRGAVERGGRKVGDDHSAPREQPSQLVARTPVRRGQRPVSSLVGHDG